MFSADTQIRVRYSETDQMGFVYHGHYITYFEVGRVEALRHLGVSYAALEKEHGIWLPVMNVQMRYLRPVHYDDVLVVRTTIPRLPTRDLVFVTEILRDNPKRGRLEIVTGGRVTLFCMDASTKSRIDFPDFLVDLLRPFY